MSSKIKYIMLPILWAAFIFMVSLISQNSLPEVNVLNIDKVVHAGVYFVLMGACWCFFYKIEKRQKSTFYLLCFACILFGLIMEVLQQELTTTRQFDWYDVVANSCGVLLFSVARKTAERFFTYFF